MSAISWWVGWGLAGLGQLICHKRAFSCGLSSSSRLAQDCPHGMAGFQESEGHLTPRLRTSTWTLLPHSVREKKRPSQIQGLGKNRLYLLIATTQSHITKGVDTGRGGILGSFLQLLYYNSQYCPSNLPSFKALYLFQQCTH